jgi:hypothetical protein
LIVDVIRVLSLLDYLLGGHWGLTGGIIRIEVKHALCYLRVWSSRNLFLEIVRLVCPRSNFYHHIRRLKWNHIMWLLWKIDHLLWNDILLGWAGIEDAWYGSLFLQMYWRCNPRRYQREVYGHLLNILVKCWGSRDEGPLLLCLRTLDLRLYWVS